jgi:hypothetical protein
MQLYLCSCLQHCLFKRRCYAWFLSYYFSAGLMLLGQFHHCSLALNHGSVLHLLVIANIPSSLLVSTLMVEAICSSETSVLTRVTWHRIPEDGILYGHWRENLKSYMGAPFRVCTKQQCSVWFLWWEGILRATMHPRLSAQYGNNVLPQWSVYEWNEKLKKLSHRCYTWWRSQTPIHNHKWGQSWACTWQGSVRQISNYSWSGKLSVNYSWVCLQNHLQQTWFH